MANKLFENSFNNIIKESGLSSKDVMDILTYLSDETASYQLQARDASLAHHMLHGQHFHLKEIPRFVDDSLLSNLKYLNRSPVIVDYRDVGDLFTIEAYLYNSSFYVFKLYKGSNPDIFTMVTLNNNGDIVADDDVRYVRTDRIYYVAYALEEYRKAMEAKSEDIYVPVEACRLLEQDSSQSPIYLV